MQSLFGKKRDGSARYDSEDKIRRTPRYAMIRLENIHKTFYQDKNEVNALNGISLHVNKGDIYGIIGLSGAGKSTLVRCINLLERPSAGSVTVAGQNLLELNSKQLRQARKKIGMIFQGFNLLKSKTIFENVAFSLKIDKVDKSVIKERVTELLKLVELEDKANAYPDELSGGQKQRVGIARALANSPDILLCDEATSALDPKTTLQILDLLKRINQTLNITIVVITHEMNVIKSICNRVAILEHGQVIKEGSVLDIFSSDSNEKIEGFLEESRAREFVTDERLMKLIFVGDASERPILSTIIRTLNVDFNIIYGKIEQIQDSDLGRLVVGVRCDDETFDEILKMFGENGVKVEVINE